MEKYTGLEVAIIGIAGKFPGAPDLDHFWQNIRAGKESISFFSEEELANAGESPSRLEDPNYVKACSYMEDKGQFDAAFFGYTPDEARLMDPQIRMFHECTWSALENAGIKPGDNSNKIGLFAGTSNNMNWEVYARLKNGDGKVDALTAEQVSSSRYMVSRVAHKLNLTGPAVYVDTACSTSLVALHQAYNSLLLGDCNVALAGGVTVHNRTQKGYQYIDGMIYSSDGHCRTFDADAHGTVEGEGTGVVVLKKLKNAIEDGDHIWAVLKGSAVNNDGDNKVAYTAPSVEGQMTAILGAQKWGKVDPSTIQFIEAHGTATVLGDPIEMEALKRVFGNEPGQNIAINSIKANLGHTRAAAGVAGLLKTILALHHEEIPPSPNFEKPNPKIDFENSPFFVNTEALPWTRSESPRRAGISSFGIGGTNAHAILEEAPVRDETFSEDRQLLTISAKSEESLQGNLKNLADYLKAHPDTDLADVAFTWQTGRSHFPFRSTIVAKDIREAVTKLETLQPIAQVQKSNGKPFTKIFLFTGQGAQYQQMYRELYMESEIFKSAADQCFDILIKSLGLDLKAIVFADGYNTGNEIDQTQFTQPALFVMEYAFTRYMMELGISPDLMLGHSIGEYVAAYFAGVFSLENALRIVVKRGELMQKAPHGTMLSISASIDDIQIYLDQFPTLDVAAVNSTSLAVISGPEIAIEELSKTLEAASINCRKLRTSHAFHSHLMDDILEEFRSEMNGIEFSSPTIPVVNNVTGLVSTNDELTSPDYWVRQLRGTVNFATGIETCLTYANPLFIEIGPGRALSTFVKSHQSREKEPAISMVKGPKDAGHDMEVLLKGIGDLWKAGLTIDWTRIQTVSDARIIPLPTYAFEATEFPVEVNAADLIRSNTNKGQLEEVTSGIYAPSWKIVSNSIESTPKRDLNTLVFSNSVIQFGKEHSIFVKPGSEFEQIDDRTYQINPGIADDYRQLFESLKTQGNLPERIIHEWSITTEGQSTNFDLRLYSLIQLLKVVKSENLTEVEWVVLTRGLFEVTKTEDLLDPYQGMILGLLKVITLESPTHSTRLLDVESTTSVEDITKCIQNAFDTTNRHNCLAIRSGLCFEQVFEQVKIIPEAKNIVVGGVYVITGGLGKLGYNLARHLLVHYQAKVILLGKSPLADSKEKQDRFDRLCSKGEVQYFNLDLADTAELKEVVDQIEDTVGAVNGLIHAAGVSATKKRKPVHELEKGDFDYHFQPKVWSLNTLVEVFGPKELDFALLTSSLSSVIGSLGFGAYAAASAYMDFVPIAHGLKNWVSVSLDGLGFGDVSEGVISEKDQLQLIECVAGATHHRHVAISVTHLPSRIDSWLNTANTKDIEAQESAAPVVDNLEVGLLNLLREFFGKDVNLNDDFFDLGGDSLKALTVIGRIQKQLRVDLSIEDFFKNTSVRSLLTFLENASRDDEKVVYQPVPVVDIADHYPLSSAQKRLYYLFELDPQSIAYNQPKVLKLFGELDVTKLSNAFQALGETHEILRTSYQVVEGEPVQVVQPEFTLSFQELACAEEEARNLVTQEVRPFDLNSGEVFRVTLLRIHEGYHVLLVDMHHIVTDGFSHALLLKDFVRLYKEEELSVSELTYKDYAAWQQSDDYQLELSEQLTFWKDQFSDEIRSLELPYDHERSSQHQFAGDLYEFELGSEELRWLQKVAEEEQTTLYVVTLSLYLVLLYRLSGQNEITVGTPVAGRNHPDLEQVVGMFVNTLALKNDLDPNQNFREWVAAVHHQTIACFNNQDIPFDQVIEALELDHDGGRNPLFDVAFSFQNFEQSQLALPNITLAPFEYAQRISKFDLNLIVVGTSDKMTLNFEYATSLFDQTTIARFASFLDRIVKGLANGEHKSISEVDILDQAEKDFILKEFNATRVDYPRDCTLVELFEEQASIHPHHVVLSTQDRSYTYEEVDQRSSVWAAWIASKVGSSQKIIPVLSERSAEAVIAYLGILKSGNAFAPVDPDFPTNRILDLIDSMDSDVVLAQASHLSKLPDGKEVLTIDEEIDLDHSVSFRSYQGVATDLAYVMYTSGSTGKPKSVGVSQRNVIRLVRNTNYLDFSRGLNIVQTGAPAFDATTYEIWGCLLNVGCLHVTSKEVLLDNQLLGDLLSERKIDTMFMTTGLFNVHAKANPEIFQGLDHLMVGGEVANTKYFNRVRELNPELTLYNIYGPTENTTFSLYHLIERDYETNIPIGIPIGNTRAYVLDDQQNLMPLGVAGELYVAGEGVAIGYLNDEVLTQERFLADPFFPGERMYKTGDLALLNHDGAIEFRGRVDNQLKINGYRVELSEIEHHILEHPSVREALVVVNHQESGKELTVYYVNNEPLQGQELKQFLAGRVPKYMIPGFYQPMDRIPLALNGKFDRKALPKPTLSNDESFEPPVTSSEKVLVDLWAKVLKQPAESISIDAGFFDLGGHSLTATSLVNIIRKECETTLSLRDFLEQDTIRKIGSFIDKTEKVDYKHIPSTESSEDYVLSSAQKRLYFLQQFDPQSTTYNITNVLELKGELDETKLRETFNKLIDRHEILRTACRQKGDQAVQVVLENVPFEIEVSESRDLDSEMANFTRPFDLEKPPLLRVRLIKHSESHHYLLTDMHHIVTDGLSQGILIKELSEIYAQRTLTPLAIQYKDYAVWQQSEDQQNELADQRLFWLDRLAEPRPKLELPLDHKRPSVQSHEGNAAHLILSAEKVSKLVELAQKEQTSLFVVLFSVFNVLISKLSRQQDVIIGTPVSGRTHPDVEPLLGMFTNTLALRNEVAPDKGFTEFLHEVNGNCVASFDRQDFPYEDLIQELNVGRDMGRNPLFDVVFSFQEFAGEHVKVDGLDISPVEVDHRSSKFDMTLYASRKEGELLLYLEYATSLFERSTIERFLSYFENLVDGILRDDHQRIRDLNVVQPSEAELLLEMFDNSEVHYPSEATVLDLFNEQVRNHPDRVALKCSDVVMTYSELDAKSDHIGKVLRKRGIGANDIVGLLMGRSIDLIVSMLGVLKSGAAYMPLDPDYPQDRLKYILNNSRAKWIIHDDSNGDLLTYSQQLSYQSVLEESVEGLSLIASVKPSDLCYVIYTSGSTGNPKGVMIEHGNVVRLFRNDEFQFDFGNDDTWTLFHSPCFDFSVWEIYGALLFGGKLIIVPKMVARDTAIFRTLLKEEQVTVLSQTPSAFYNLISVDKQCSDSLSLRYVIFGGEALSPAKLRDWRPLNPETKLINMYGITETTVHVTYKEIGDLEIDQDVSDIGRPIPTLSLYLLDENMELVPNGTIGELYVGGAGVARGYLNNPELTNERFIQNPFRPEERLYKSGDLARLKSNGALEYLGRSDFQVKIRGHRIEPGEIESAITQIASIDQVTVQPREVKGVLCLVAYYTTVGEVDALTVKSKLQNCIPEYMVPAYFMQLDKMPLTVNGKLDVRSLPEPKVTKSRAVLSPATEHEMQLARIWEEILELEPGFVSRDANFFDIGGHSINATALVNQVESRLSTTISIREIFEKPVLMDLAELIGTKAWIGVGAVEDSEEVII